MTSLFCLSVLRSFACAQDDTGGFAARPVCHSEERWYAVDDACVVARSTSVTKWKRRRISEPTFAQIFPFRVHRFNEHILFLPSPPLQFLFSFKRRHHIRRCLIVDKLMHMIPFRKSVCAIVLMLKQSVRQVIRDTDVHDTIALVCQNVNAVLLREHNTFHHTCHRRANAMRYSTDSGTRRAAESQYFHFLSQSCPNSRATTGMASR